MKPSSGGVSFNLAGSVSYNDLDNSATAQIGTSAISSAGDVLVTAADTSEITAVAGAAAVSITSGSSGFAIGFSLAINEIQNHVTEVLTACSFQDITGQRTTKVVNTLQYIEQRVSSMIEIWGVQGGTPAPAPARDAEDNRPDAHLMNGPAADGGPSQADVDALFEKLGKATESGDAAKSADGQTNSQSQIDAMFGTAH